MGEGPDVHSKIRFYYDSVRGKIEHEDGLVNQRMMWMLTINGLLFSAYGFSLGAEAAISQLLAQSDSPASAISSQFRQVTVQLVTVRYALAVVGISSALLSLAGIFAAYRAIRADAKDFLQYANSFPHVDYFPLPVGRLHSHLFGMSSGLILPYVIAGAWLALSRQVPTIIFVPGLIAAVLATYLVTILPLLPRRDHPHPAPAPVDDPV